jgi:hypothetical protein
MTRDDDFMGQLEGYLDEFEGDTRLPDEVRFAVRAQLTRTQQIGPISWPMRYLTMNRPLQVAVAGLVVVAAAVLGFGLYGPNVGLEPTPRPISATSSPTSVTPSPVPRPAAWVATGSMNVARSQASATLLASGKVLVAGGFQGIIDAEVYDPASGTWSITGQMATGRRYHTASLLPDGSVLVSGGLVGGGGPGTESLKSAELYYAGRWTGTAPMLTARHSHTATVLIDGRVLIVGGAAVVPGIVGDGAYGGRDLASCEIYDPVARTWSTTGSLTTVRGGNIATLLRSGDVLVVGGAPQASAELYKPATGTWTSAGDLPLADVSTATLLEDGKVLVTGAEVAQGPAVAAVLYDPTAGIWTRTASLLAPGITAIALMDGNVLVLASGGVELYHPNSGTWTPTAEMATPAFNNYAAIALADGRVLVAGGEEVVPHRWLTAAELYLPAIGD